MPPRDRWEFIVEAEPRGKRYEIITPRGSGFAHMKLKKKPTEFEQEVCRIASQVLPVFPDGTMLGIRVVSVKKRPDDQVGRPPERIPCPVRPDAANVLKCVEDALMRCRLCYGSKKACNRQRGHRYSPTLVDDSHIVDTGCKTVFSSVDRCGKFKKDWKIKPSRIEVLVWVVQQTA